MSVQFHHVALTVRNLQESIEWYKNIFGCKVVRIYDMGDTHIALLSLGDNYVELFHLDDTKPLPVYRREVMNDLRVVGTKHIGFQVDNLQVMMKRLEQKGVDIVTRPDTTFFGGRYAFIRDCNDILLELYEEGK